MEPWGVDILALWALTQGRIKSECTQMMKKRRSFSNKVFADQIGCNIEVYIVDMVSKTSEKGDYYSDLAEIFEQIWQHDMRLNPEKCIFGVQVGKFLRFMLTSRGIKANPDKCWAI